MQTRALPKSYKMQTNLVYQSCRQSLSTLDKVCLSWNWRCREPHRSQASMFSWRPTCHACTSWWTMSRRHAWFVLLLGGIYTTQKPASIAQAFLPPCDPEAMPPHSHLKVSSRQLRTKPRSSVFCVAGFLTYTRPSGCVSDGP